MTRNSVLAELLYTKAIEMKTMPFPLFFSSKSKRRMAENFNFLQFVTSCLAMQTISDHEADRILEKLVSDFHFSNADFFDAFQNAKAFSDHSPEYQDILFLMNDILSSCMAEILRKTPDKIKLRRLCFAFHNLPRAFLSLSDHRKISPAEAISYSTSFLIEPI
ncbi:MAG: hypothetical protein J6D19_01880 [Clostridia bacterium]|nr:hypothetical protein [Clostridia bacterium]